MQEIFKGKNYKFYTFFLHVMLVMQQSHLITIDTNIARLKEDPISMLK